jgi:hypothetical protein
MRKHSRSVHSHVVQISRGYKVNSNVGWFTISQLHRSSSVECGCQQLRGVLHRQVVQLCENAHWFMHAALVLRVTTCIAAAYMQALQQCLIQQYSSSDNPYPVERWSLVTFIMEQPAI